jgi:hypothetical protein
MLDVVTCRLKAMWSFSKEGVYRGGWQGLHALDEAEVDCGTGSRSALVRRVGTLISPEIWDISTKVWKYFVGLVLKLVRNR